MGDEPKVPRRVKVPGRFVPAWWAPKVLGGGHQDTPLSSRGRLVFYTLVGALIVGGVVLILAVR